jgi:hypothetical protein
LNTRSLHSDANIFQSSIRRWRKHDHRRWSRRRLLLRPATTHSPLLRQVS